MLLMEKINNIHSPAMRAATAVAAFGKSGQAMLNLIADGMPAFRDLIKEADKYGQILGVDVVAACAKFNDAQDHMNAALQGVKITIGGALMPLIQEYVDRLTKWVVKNKEFIRLKVHEWVGKIVKALKWIDDHWDSILSGLKTFVYFLIALKGVSLTINTITTAMKVFEGVTWLLNKDWTILNATILGNPLIWIGGIVIGLLMLFIKYTKGWGDQWKEVMRYMKTEFGIFYLNTVYDLLAYDWMQNILGNMTNEQLNNEIYAIDKQQKLREEQLNKIKSSIDTFSNYLDKNPLKWTIQLNNISADSSLLSNYKNFTSPLDSLNSSIMAHLPSLRANDTLPAVNNREATRNSFMEDLIKHSIEIGLNINDSTRRVEVTKNTGGIPVRVTDTVGQFGGRYKR
jgi:hypothetical protein